MSDGQHRWSNSVRLRITLWNVAALAAILIVFGAGFRWALGNLLVRSVDDAMEGQIATLARRWAKVPAARKQTLLFLLRAGPAVQRMGIFADSQKEIGDSAALLLGGAAPEGVPAYPWQLLDTKGNDYLKGKPVKPWDSSAYQESLRGKTRHTTSRLPSGDTIRICSYPIRADDGSIEAVAQTVRSLQPTTQMLRATDRLLLEFLPIALLASGLIGTLLTGQALAPVGKLSTTLARIGAADLSERLPPFGGDEFARLARIINAMLARLELAFEQQRRFTADASHELRSPLTVILGQSSLALSAPQSDENRHFWERTLRATRRMERLVSDLLMLARSDAHQLEMQFSPLRVRDLLESTVETIPETSPTDACPIEIISPDDLWIQGDNIHLERAIHNLLTNARRHTPPTGKIALSATAHEQAQVLITVADTGSGIPAEHIPHLFERFYRADKGRSQSRGGSGLGLAITHSIIEAHGGMVAIESSLNVGTTVRILLPVAARQS